MSSRPAILPRVADLFAIDLRSLAVFRIALGILMLADLGTRVPDFRVFYTEEGVWPIASSRADTLMDGPGTEWIWSFHWMNPSTEWAVALFILQGLAALALALGWKTRITSIVCWALVTSLHARNVLVLQGGDVQLRVMLFWAMFLPLGARWSLDARKRPADQPPPVTVRSISSAALLIQIVIIYVVSAILKSDPSWRVTGEASWQALSLETFATPLGLWLTQWPALLAISSFAILFLEAFGPFLAFVPWQNHRWRTGVAIAFIAFHLSLAATMYLGTFPFVSITGWLVWLPGQVWDRLRKVPESAPRPVLTEPRFVSLLSGLLLIYLILLNTRVVLGIKTPVWFRTPAKPIRLDQRWDMFAPRPIIAEGWDVVVGFYGKDGEVDLITDRVPDWSTPKSLATTYKNFRWRKYLSRIREKDRKDRLRQYIAYLKREFERRNPGHEELVQISLYSVVVSIYDRQAPLTRNEVYVWPEELENAPIAPPVQAEEPSSL